jgi:PAS domain S-box-containing protein
MGSAMVKRSQRAGHLRVSATDGPLAAQPSSDSGALFTAALEHVADMVVICDAAGRHVFLNQAARDLALTDAFGAELDPAIWGDWFDADDQPIQPEQWPLWLALRGEQRVEREMYRRNPDGGIFWMLISAAGIRDASGHTIGAVATATDITARKQAEVETRALKEELAHRVGARTAAFEALQGELAREVRQRLDASELLERSRRMLQAILDRTAAIIYVKDTAFRYLLVNAQYERVFDTANAAMAGKTDYEIFAPDIVAPLRANDEQVLASDEPLYFEEVVQHRDGELHTYVSVKFPLRGDDGVVYALCGISTDITERKRMEAELRRSQVTLATVIDSSGDGIFLIDRQHHLVLCNAAVDRLFASVVGTPPAMGIDLRPLVPRAMVERWHTLLDRALCGERLTVEESLPIDGAARHFLLSLNPITDERMVTGVTVFAREITELRQAEELARKHQAELAHVLRQHTMGAMAASLAHEINQPLGAIANYAQGSRRRLEADAMTPAEVQTTMAEIAREALRAGAITRRVRALLRKDEPSRAVADINEIVRSVLDIVAPTARERGIAVRLHQGALLPPIEVDRIQIEQVVLNLVLNALDAVEQTTAPAVDVRTTVPDHNAIEVTVSDNGPGIDPAKLRQVFEPFFTTKSGGLGMGLAISHSIIDAHDGRLWATANPTGGSIFHFMLPAASVDRP